MTVYFQSMKWCMGGKCGRSKNMVEDCREEEPFEHNESLFFFCARSLSLSYVLSWDVGRPGHRTGLCWPELPHKHARAGDTMSSKFITRVCPSKHSCDNNCHNNSCWWRAAQKLFKKTGREILLWRSKKKMIETKQRISQYQPLKVYEILKKPKMVVKLEKLKYESRNINRTPVWEKRAAPLVRKSETDPGERWKNKIKAPWIPQLQWPKHTLKHTLSHKTLLRWGTPDTG